jgi:hypothetical protein
MRHTWESDLTRSDVYLDGKRAKERQRRLDRQTWAVAALCVAVLAFAIWRHLT